MPTPQRLQHCCLRMPVADEDGGQQTMIRVIASQRDRLKERVNQLGDELSKVSPSPLGALNLCWTADR